VHVADHLVAHEDAQPLRVGHDADRRRVDLPPRAHGDDVLDERGRGLALGAAEYLVKPVSREGVLDALARCGPEATWPTS
jgi:hypothetical protein